MNTDVCPNCGAQLTAPDAFCPACRHELPASTDTAAPIDTPAALFAIPSAPQTTPELPDQRLDDERDYREFEQRLMQRTPRVPVTRVLVGLNVLVYLIMVAAGVPAFQPDADVLLRWGANYGPRTTSGEVWRLLTCTFVHIGLLHLLFNMLCLADLGRLVERLLGNGGFLMLYLLSGLGGSLASIAWAPAQVSAGASGAIFGLYGAMLGMSLRDRQGVPLAVISHHRGSTIAFLGYNLFFGVIVPGIDWMAHFGGLATGFAVAAMLGPLGPEDAARRRARVARVAVIGVLLLGLAFAGVRARVAGVADPIAEWDRIAHTEDQVLRTYNNALEKAQADRLSDEEFLRILEIEVLPPWREARERLAHVRKTTPEMNRSTVDRYARLLELREQAWELQVRAVREDNPKLMEEANQRHQQADQIVKQMEAEFNQKRR